MPKEKAVIFRVLIEPKSLARVLVHAVELDAQNFHVQDDRGGTGYWHVNFTDIQRNVVRQIVGPGVDIQDLDEHGRPIRVLAFAEE
jgi:hypothetical protein